MDKTINFHYLIILPWHILLYILLIKYLLILELVHLNTSLVQIYMYNFHIFNKLMNFYIILTSNLQLLIYFLINNHPMFLLLIFQVLFNYIHLKILLLVVLLLGITLYLNLHESYLINTLKIPYNIKIIYLSILLCISSKNFITITNYIIKFFWNNNWCSFNS